MRLITKGGGELTTGWVVNGRIDDWFFCLFLFWMVIRYHACGEIVLYKSFR